MMKWARLWLTTLCMVLHYMEWYLSFHIELHCFVCPIQSAMELEADANASWAEVWELDRIQPCKNNGPPQMYHRTTCHYQRPGTMRRQRVHVAINQNSMLHHPVILGLYNTAHNITFQDTLHNKLIPNDQGPERVKYVIIWYNFSFYLTAVVHSWFTSHSLFIPHNLPHIIHIA